MLHVKEEQDVLIVGAGIGASFVARELAKKGRKILMIEAGRRYLASEYPRNELDGNSQLYWNGGMELDTSARLIFLRPKVVGGGSVVNQALVDRFDEIVWAEWSAASGVDFLSERGLAPFYDRAEKSLTIETLSEKNANGNAKIFRSGFERCGFQWAPLRRAQKNCSSEKGNSCIDCLSGCPRDSKQSMPITVLKEALQTGNVSLRDRTEVLSIQEFETGVSVQVRGAGGVLEKISAQTVVLGAGAIGNSKLLLQSGWGERLPALGRYFWGHPQYMHLGVYDQKIGSHLGPLQTYKSDEPRFRELGFKLENVFAPPIAIALLIPGVGSLHQDAMKELGHLACIEISLKDSEPGRISLKSDGRLRLEKPQNREDEKRKLEGIAAMHRVFKNTGAHQIHSASFGVSLHLMGGCRLGQDPNETVTGPDFRVHGSKRVSVCDGSLFPTAPGINPSLTIMALALRAAESIGVNS